MTVSIHPQTDRPARRAFDETPEPEIVDRTAHALRERGIDVRVAQGRAEAKALVLASLPEGASVHRGASITLDELEFDAAIAENGTWTPIRPQIRSMDRATQGDEIRRLGASPDVIVGSVHAITEQGEILVASKTGSQLAGYAFGAGKVVLVVGTQKIVPDLAAAWQRLNEHVLPHEHQRMQAAYGVNSEVGKALLINSDRPGRITVIFVTEAIGD